MSNVTPVTAHRIALCSLGMALSAACTITDSYERRGQHPNDYGVDLYEPFDNSRDWGPAGLVGPPSNAEEYPRSEFRRSSGNASRPVLPMDSIPSIPSDPADGTLP